MNVHVCVTIIFAAYIVYYISNIKFILHKANSGSQSRDRLKDLGVQCTMQTVLSVSYLYKCKVFP